MKILYLNYEWDPQESTGALTHIRELSKGLRELGHSVTVIDRRRKPIVQSLTNETLSKSHPAAPQWRARLSPYLHESAAMGRALKGIRVEIELIRREKPDVVLTRHSLHQFSSIWAARRCRVPVVYEVNAPAPFEYRHYQSQYRLIPKLAEWLERHMLSKTDGIFVVSKVLKRYFVDRGVSADHIRVIPNGADVERFSSAAADPSVREKLGEASLIVGFVGSFARFHGIDQLEQAMGFLCAQRPDARFLLVGSGEMSEKVQDYCSRRGLTSRVYFTGHVLSERVPALMAAADILLAPYEPQDFFYLSPIKIFEYMAAGKAVLAARVGQIAELIQDGVDGILYDPSDSSSLQQALRTLAENSELRKCLGGNAQRTVGSRYTWRANAASVESLLSEVVARQKARDL
ncbi:MAG: glycosyltransferase family 4 protein [Acidobacteria bacterium]|nr:glycosyltransferase family 4 protein [Acidobacteriota bacterium]